jgi:hypothetical protein
MHYKQLVYSPLCSFAGIGENVASNCKTLMFSESAAAADENIKAPSLFSGNK